MQPFINRLRTGAEDGIDEDSDNAETEGNLIGISEVQIPMDGNEDEDDGQDAGDMPPLEEMDDGQEEDAGRNNMPPLLPTHGNNEGGHLPPVFEDEEDELEAFMRAQEEQEMEDEQNDAPEPDPLEDDDEPDLGEVLPNPNPRQPAAGNGPNNPRPRDDVRFEPQFEPLQPAFADLDAQDDGAVSTMIISTSIYQIL